MAKMNIMESDLVYDVRKVTKDVLELDKEEKADESIVFGNLDIPMQELDAAIMKLQHLSRTRLVYISEEA